ncbi:WD40 repeat domain-containing protein [Roseimaritima ulvae]|uniref:Chromosome partition protein Smc n=1 Tax=Roseimaritima ulvae TaxID=980254 RepID=A0A5B9QIG8_9BACT|nr:c-type cytochrome domain-containing protein [Roseimaritima ulvae]QEG38684.1 Chromosome partition protein Smc [Roseimaritima ulvae]
MPTRSLATVFPLLMFALLAIRSPAARGETPLPIVEPQRNDAVDYATEIQPLLKRNCVACHREQESEGGLVLETLAAIRSGGDSGPGVVAKHPEESPVLSRARGMGDGLMPPEDNSVGAEPLTAEQLGLLKLWIEQGAEGTDAAQSKPIKWQPIPESIRSTYALAVSPDGRLAAFNRANRVIVLDLVTQTEVARLVDPGLDAAVADVDMIQSIAFSPDGRRIATGGFRTVRLWHNTPLEEPAALLSHVAGLVATNADQSRAAWVNAIGDIEVWDLANASRLQTLTGQADRVSALQWCDAVNRLYAGDEAGHLRVWNLNDGSLIAETLTPSAVVQLAVSDDGTHVIKRTQDRTVELFRFDAAKEASPASLQRVHESLGGVTDATAIALVSKPALTVVVASEAKGVVLIEPIENEVSATIDHGAVVTALAVSNDQTQLASGGRDGKTRLWKLADKQPLVSLTGTPEQQRLLTQTRRDIERQKQVLASLAKKTTELTAMLTKEDEALAKVTASHKEAQEKLAASQKKQLEATALVTSTEAKLAAATAEEAKAKELNAAATKRRVEAEATAEQVEAAKTEIEAATQAAATAKASIAETTKQLETAKAAAKTASEAETKAKTEASKFENALRAATTAQQRAAAAIPTHQAIVVAAEQQARLFDQRLADAQQHGSGPQNQVLAISFEPTGTQVATSHADGSTRIYRTHDAQPLMVHPAAPGQQPVELTFVGPHLVRAGVASPASVFAWQTEWQWERTIGSVDDDQTIVERVTALDFHRDGAALAVGSGKASQSGEVKIFAVQTGQVVKAFGDVHQDTVLSLAFSPDGRTLASAAADRMIHLLDVATGATRRSLEGHTHHVLGQAWQADGQTLASSSADQTVRIWNTLTGETSRTISGFGKEVTAIAYLPGTTQVVAASGNGQVRVAEASNGKTVRTLDAGGDFLYAVAVTPDGKKVLAAGESGVLRVWNAADGKLLAEF